LAGPAALGSGCRSTVNQGLGRETFSAGSLTFFGAPERDAEPPRRSVFPFGRRVRERCRRARDPNLWRCASAVLGFSAFLFRVFPIACAISARDERADRDFNAPRLAQGPKRRAQGAKSPSAAVLVSAEGHVSRLGRKTASCDARSQRPMPRCWSAGPPRRNSAMKAIRDHPVVSLEPFRHVRRRHELRGVAAALVYFAAADPKGGAIEHGTPFLHPSHLPIHRPGRPKRARPIQACIGRLLRISSKPGVWNKSLSIPGQPA